jgi:hypothetical protein
MIENLTKNFKDFKSSPITYILLVVFSLCIYVIQTDRGEKTKALETCIENERRLNEKFQDLFFKKEKVIQNDSLINKL